MAVSHDMKAKERQCKGGRENAHLCTFALTCIGNSLTEILFYFSKIMSLQMFFPLDIFN